MNILVMVAPLLLAGLTFVLFLKLAPSNIFSYPLDFGKKFKGKRILGSNKTFKGPILMSIFTGVYGTLLTSANSDTFLRFFVVGLIYSLGELPNSFIKRQFDIAPGRHPNKYIWSVLSRVGDNFDSLVLCGLAYYYFFNFAWKEVIPAVIIGGLAHLIINQLMIHLRMKA